MKISLFKVAISSPRLRLCMNYESRFHIALNIERWRSLTNREIHQKKILIRKLLLRSYTRMNGRNQLANIHKSDTHTLAQYPKEKWAFLLVTSQTLTNVERSWEKLRDEKKTLTISTLKLLLSLIFALSTQLEIFISFDIFRTHKCVNANHLN